MVKSILKIDKIDKSFGATHANDRVCMELFAGEVHGFAGENGSGKSTLASIICGINRPDSGEMYMNGEPYAPKNPKDANRQKVAMVVQELGILSNLPVMMNIFMGRMDEFMKARFINLRKMAVAAQEVLDKWELGPIPLYCFAGELSIEQRKIVELARALATDPDILVLDEITQALSHDIREKLYKVIKRLTGMGKTVLLITHDIEEMIMLADNITVLRDGAVVGVAPHNEMDIDTLRRMMIGRELNKDYYRTDEIESYGKDVILEVNNLNVTNKVRNVSLELHKGEILAVCGLSDSGIHHLGKAIYGVERNRAGTVRMPETGKLIKTPIQMVDNGGVFLSKDRDEDGLMLYDTIEHNMFIPSAKIIAGRFGFVQPKKVRMHAQKAIDEFNIKATDIHQIVRSLSGGNKQKVNLSRWLITKELKYLVLDCPTRGVDVGVKAYLYGLMKELKKKGIGILMISDEMSEAMGMADRIMVMKNGEVKKIIGRSSHFTESAIIEAML